jgi:hypothetical protein
MQMHPISMPVGAREFPAHNRLAARVHRPVRVPLFREGREVWVEVERGGLVEVGWVIPGHA